MFGDEIDDGLDAELIWAADGRFLDFGGIEVSSDHEWSVPTNDEWVDGRMVTDNEVQRKGTICLVFGESYDVIDLLLACRHH